MSKQSALQLLAEYGDDGQSSDDDVPGPRVSTKRTYKEDSFNTRLPVPECIKKLKENQAWTDTPSEHKGRVRSFQHERGNWATFAFVLYEGHQGLNHLMKSIISLIPEVLLEEVDEFHISLTRTVILKHHWIFPFANSLKERVTRYGRFVALFGGFKVYCNEERTRTFIGLEITSGCDTLHALVMDFDQCLSEFQLPLFYEDPSFHMSILWCLGDVESKLCSYLPQLNERLQEIMADYLNENWYILEQLSCCLDDMILNGYKEGTIHKSLIQV